MDTPKSLACLCSTRVKYKNTLGILNVSREKDYLKISFDFRYVLKILIIVIFLNNKINIKYA